MKKKYLYKLNSNIPKHVIGVLKLDKWTYIYEIMAFLELCAWVPTMSNLDKEDLTHNLQVVNFF